MGVQLTYHPIPPPGNAAFEVLSILLFIHYTCLPSRRQIFRAEQSTPGCLHGNWHWFFRQHSCSIKNDPFVFLKWFHICIKSNPCPENFRGRGHPSMLQAIKTGNYIRVPCYAAWQQKFFAPLQKNEEWLSRLPCAEWNHGAPVPTKAANHVRDERSIGLTVWDFRPSVLQMEHCTTSKRK